MYSSLEKRRCRRHFNNFILLCLKDFIAFLFNSFINILSMMVGLRVSSCHFYRHQYQFAVVMLFQLSTTYKLKRVRTAQDKIIIPSFVTMFIYLSVCFRPVRFIIVWSSSVVVVLVDLMLVLLRWNIKKMKKTSILDNPFVRNKSSFLTFLFTYFIWNQWYVIPTNVKMINFWRLLSGSVPTEKMLRNADLLFFVHYFH